MDTRGFAEDEAGPNISSVVSWNVVRCCLEKYFYKIDRKYEKVCEPCEWNVVTNTIE